MTEPSFPDSPPPNKGSNAREQRFDWLITCAADTLHLTGNPRRNFIDYSKRQIIFAPQAAASGVVLAPRQARRLERLRAVYDSGLIFALLGTIPLVFFTHQIGWGSTLILLFLVCWFAVIVWIVTIMSWSTGIPAVYQAMPPPGCAITADTDALTIDSAVVPWSKVVLAAIWLREGTRLWFGASWNIPESIDRLTLRADGETLMLDRNVVTNGQVLLDTICDKLDMTVGLSQSRN